MYGDHQFLFWEHLQMSSDTEGLRFQTELFPLTNVLYTFYEYFMFNDIMLSLLKINIVLIESSKESQLWLVDS